MAIYLEYEGINGNVTAEGYKNHIEINAVDFGVSMEPGKLSNRESGYPVLSEASLNKTIDGSICKAVKAKKWAEAAAESNRPQVKGPRNQYVRELFEAASAKDKDADKNAAP